MRKHLRVYAAVSRVGGKHVAEEAHEVAVHRLLNLLERLCAVDGVERKPQLLFEFRVPVDRQLQDADDRGVVCLVNIHHRVDESVPAAYANIRACVLRRKALVHELLHVTVVVQEREHGVALHQQLAYLAQIQLWRIGAYAAVELGEHAAAAEVGVEEHFREFVPHGPAVLVAAAEGHWNLQLVVQVAVERPEAIVMAVRNDKEVRHEVACFIGGESSGRKVGLVEVVQHSVGSPERELVRAVNVAEYLAREPERVETLEEGFRRLPRAALRGVRCHTHPVALAVGEAGLRKNGFGGLCEGELYFVHRVESDERRFKLLPSMRIVRRAFLERGCDLGANAAEALGENRAERRHVVHVVRERAAAERQRLAAAGVEDAELLVGDECLLLVELRADAVHEPSGPSAAPSAVDARLEVERRLGEDVRHEVPAHREVAFASHVKRVEAGVGGAPRTKVGLDALVAFKGSRILRRHTVALSVRRIERAQLLTKRRIVLCPKRVRRTFNGIEPNRCGKAQHRSRRQKFFSCQHCSITAFAFDLSIF